MYPPVTCYDGVVVSRDDFLDAVLRPHDFVVGPQAFLFEVLTILVFELPGGLVEEVGLNLGVLTIVLHPVVENGVCRGDETSNDVGDRDDGSIELFRFSVFVH